MPAVAEVILPEATEPADRLDSTIHRQIGPGARFCNKLLEQPALVAYDLTFEQFRILCPQILGPKMATCLDLDQFSKRLRWRHRERTPFDGRPLISGEQQPHIRVVRHRLRELAEPITPLARERVHPGSDHAVSDVRQREPHAVKRTNAPSAIREVDLDAR